MGKDFRAHVILNLCPHHMAKIRDEIITEALHGNQYQHHDAKRHDFAKRLLNIQSKRFIGDIAHHQRNHQRHARSDNRKKHICKKQWHVRPIIRRQLL